MNYNLKTEKIECYPCLIAVFNCPDCGKNSIAQRVEKDGGIMSKQFKEKFADTFIQCIYCKTAFPVSRTIAIDFESAMELQRETKAFIAGL